MRKLSKSLGRVVGVAALATVLVALAPALGPVGPLGGSGAVAETTTDPRAGDVDFERSRRLFGLVRETLNEAAELRRQIQNDPEGRVEEAFWRQFGMDDRGRVDDLVAAAFEIVIDAPVVEMQQEIEGRREEIATMRRQIAELKEQRISAPEDGGVAVWVGLEEDRESLGEAIEELERRIAGQEARIAEIKLTFSAAMTEAGAPLPPEQIDLLLDSVTGSDIVELAAAYEAVRGVSTQLRDLMDDSGEDLEIARRYYGMHTVLIAILLEGQNRILFRIDADYLPRLAAIEQDLIDTAAETERLLADTPTPEHRQALEANQESQRIALDALRLYREYLLGQRALIARARERTIRELEVADNTLRTVEASFQLKELMDNAAASFEALMALESPGIERLFQNEELRREFQLLTDRMAPPS